MEKIIKNKLVALSPIKLELINESHKHAGHAGWNNSGNTHFNLLIVSDAFINQTKIQRHKMICESLYTTRFQNSQDDFIDIMWQFITTL